MSLLSSPTLRLTSGTATDRFLRLCASSGYVCSSNNAASVTLGSQWMRQRWRTRAISSKECGYSSHELINRNLNGGAAIGIYINSGYISPDGSTCKHVEGWCHLLLERHDAGHPIVRVRNDRTDRRPCPACFYDGGPLTVAMPQALTNAIAFAKSHPSPAWIYEVTAETHRVSQVGMATDVADRLRRRWRATCARRLAPDGIPWLHDLLADDSDVNLTCTVSPFPSRQLALVAEDRRRRELRAAGWRVSSDR
jgi:hypothetical protein